MPNISQIAPNRKNTKSQVAKSSLETGTIGFMDLQHNLFAGEND